MVSLEVITLEETEEFIQKMDEFDKLGIGIEPEAAYDVVCEAKYIDLKYVTSISVSKWTINSKEYTFPLIILSSGEQYIVNTNPTILHEAVVQTKKSGSSGSVFPKLI